MTIIEKICICALWLSGIFLIAIIITAAWLAPSSKSIYINENKWKCTSTKKVVEPHTVGKIVYHNEVEICNEWRLK